MTKQTEALKLALEAITTYLSESPDPSEEAVEGLCDARALIAKALTEQPAQRCWKCGDMDVAFQMKCTVPACGMKEQPAQQEPVAWMIWTHGPVLVFMNKDEAKLEFDRLNHAYPEPMRMLVPLYTSPPTLSLSQRTWVGLTDEERNTIYANAGTGREAMKVIEAKLREKNT